MALSAAYAACTTVICLEVVVIFGLLAFLFKKSDDAGSHMKPDAQNVATDFGRVEQEEEQQPEEPKYIIEYDPDPAESQVIEEEGEDERASSIQSQRDPLTTSVIPEILLPSQEAFKRPPAGSSSDSQSSDEEMEAKEPPVVVVDVESPHPIQSESSRSSLSQSEVLADLPLVIPPIPDDVPESEIVLGADDVELDNGWRRQVKLSALQRTRLIDRTTIEKYLVGDMSKEELQGALKSYLDGDEPIAGIVMMDTGEKKSIYKAAKEGYIRRGTAISILEAQAATGNIIDPLTGAKMSVTEAAQLGLLDKIYEQCLLRAERAVSGYKTRLTDDKVSVFEAMTKGLVVEDHAIRLLESQLATGGIIDVRNNHRVPIEYALKRGLIDERIYRILKESPTANKSFEDPNTDEKVNYEDLMGRCIVDMDTGLRLLPFEKPTMPKEGRSQSSSPISSSSFERVPSLGSVASKKSKPASEIPEEAEAAKSPKLSSLIDIDINQQEKEEPKLSSDSEAEVEPAVQIVDETKSVTSRSSLGKSPKSLHETESLQKSQSEVESASPKLEKVEEPVEPAEEVKPIEPKPSVSEKIDKFKQKIEEVQKREREEEEREREIEKQKRDEEKSKKDKVPKDWTTDTATEQSGLELSSDDTDKDEQNRLELSSLTTSDAQTDIEKDDEMTKIEREMNKIVGNKSITQELTSSDEQEPPTIIDRGRQSARKSKRKKKDKKDSSSVPSTPKTPKSTKLSKKLSTPKLQRAPSPKPPTIPSDTEMPTGDPTGPTREREEITFTTGWRKQCHLEDLLEAGLISESKVKRIESGHLLEAEAENELAQWLHGTSPIAGLLIIQTGEKMSLYSAAKRGFLRRGTAISLLEAQAATGNVIDPITGEYMAVEQATRTGLIDRQYEAILARAEKAVYGYKSKFSEDNLSIYEALQKGMLIENHAIRLLEAQIVTGGIVDPHKHHRVPIDLAIKRGLYDNKLKDVLDGNNDDVKGFFDPNTEENLNYSELVERCVTDAETGLLLLPFKKKPPEEKLSGPLAKVLFESELRRKVTLQDVVDAELIEPETLKRFQAGDMSAHEVKQLVDSLKIHVEGSMPIAGVINAENGQKLSIYQATKAGLIRKGTAYELLEAQAACGKIVDVQTGRVLSVDTASKTGVFDAEYEDVVMRASRAVTGYREPFKKEILSLCEAISRHLVVERNGVRLLEAQVATGGIIDMKSPLRLSIEAALRKGLLESRLAKQLQAKTSKSYFDPNTGENLNYAGLMERCVTCPDTNLLFLEVEMGAVTPRIEPFEPEEKKKKKIRSSSVDVGGSKKKKKKKDEDKKDKDRAQSEPRPGVGKDKKKDKKDKKKKKDKGSRKDLSKIGRDSPKSDKSARSPMSPKSYTSIDIDTPSTSKSNAGGTPKKMKSLEPPSKSQMLGVEPKKDKKKKKRDRSKEKEIHIRASSSEREKVEMKNETSQEPKKKKKKKPSKKPSKPPKIVSRKVVIVDPDGNELSLEDALKFGYIDEKMAAELRAQEQDEEDAQ